MTTAPAPTSDRCCSCEELLDDRLGVGGARDVDDHKLAVATHVYPQKRAALGFRGHEAVDLLGGVAIGGERQALTAVSIAVRDRSDADARCAMSLWRWRISVADNEHAIGTSAGLGRSVEDMPATVRPEPDFKARGSGCQPPNRRR